MLKRGLVVLGAVALVGCGGGDPLGEGDAQLAWEATQGAFGGNGSQPNALTVAVDCMDGGKIKWKYNLLDGVTTSATGTNVDLEYKLVFKGCKHNGVKISGTLVYTIGSTTNADGAQVRWGYEGKLRYSGDINGSCEYDMYGQIAANSSGSSVSYEGSICGNDASATLNVSATGVSNNVNGDPVDDGSV